MRPALAAAVVAVALTGCGGGTEKTSPQPSAEAARALRVAGANRWLRELLAGVPYSFASERRWTLAGTRVGVVVTVRLAEAIDRTADWPVAHPLNPGADPPYAEEEATCTATGVRSLVLRVDLRRKRLVAVEPGVGAHVQCLPERD